MPGEKRKLRAWPALVAFLLLGCLLPAQVSADSSVSPSSRAAQLQQGYAPTRETTAIVALTTLVTGLAMNYVQRGSYLP